MAIYDWMWELLWVQWEDDETKKSWSSDPINKYFFHPPFEVFSNDAVFYQPYLMLYFNMCIRNIVMEMAKSSILA